MIQQMRTYTYTKPSNTLDAYGFYPQTTGGSVLMRINIKSSSYTVTNPIYNDVEYIGATYSNDITEGCQITYGDMTLKVLYVIKGRVNQILMQRVS